MQCLHGLRDQACALCSPIDLSATLVIVLLECASSVQIRFVQLSVRFYENPVPSQLVTEKWSFRLPPEFLELLLRGVELHVRNLVADDDEHDSLVECRLFYCGSLYLLRVGEHAACRKSLLRRSLSEPVSSRTRADQVMFQRRTIPVHEWCSCVTAVFDLHCRTRSRLLRAPWSNGSC